MYTWKFGIVIFISLRQANDIKKKKKKNRTKILCSQWFKVGNLSDIGT